MGNLGHKEDFLIKLVLQSCAVGCQLLAAIASVARVHTEQIVISIYFLNRNDSVSPSPSANIVTIRERRWLSSGLLRRAVLQKFNDV
jgi:hypothetical protein